MSNQLSVKFLSGLVVATTAFSTQALAASITILPDGHAGYGSSADGSVVCGFNATQYYIWTQANGLQLIGGLSAGNGIGGTPRLNDAGTILAGTARNLVTNLAEASTYNVATGVWTNQGALNSFSGTEASSGWGISNDGTKIVGLGWIGGATAGRAIVTPLGGTPVNLGSTTGRSSRGNAANQDGTIVAGWQDSSSGSRQGTIWTNGVQTLLFYGATTGLCGEISDITPSGTYAVGATFNIASIGGVRAYRWSAATGGVSLGTVFTAAWRGAATGISSNGQRVVGFYRPFPGPATFGEGFMWFEGIGMISLNNLANQLSLSTGGATMSLPLHLSEDGSTIVGQARITTPPSSPGFVYSLPSLIEGVVTLQNNDASATDETLTYVVKDPGTGNTVQSGTATCFASGGIVVENTAGIGTFDVYVKGTKWLQKKISGVQFGAVQARFSASLINGDADQNNEVGPGDFELIVASFGTTSVDPGWVANADLDDNGEVGPSDFEIVTANFGTQGD